MTERPIVNGNGPEPEEERPPAFQSWGAWYAVILAELVLLIVVFRLIMVVFG